MSEQKRYASNAERQKAYRERKKAAEESLPEPEPIQRSLPPGTPTLEEYVNEALRGAELHYEQTSPHATASTKTLGAQLDNAERYARWRYEGFVSGEVLSL